MTEIYQIIYEASERKFGKERDFKNFLCYVTGLWKTCGEDKRYKEYYQCYYYNLDQMYKNCEKIDSRYGILRKDEYEQLKNFVLRDD